MTRLAVLTKLLIVAAVALAPLGAQKTRGWIDGDRANSAVWESAGSSLVNNARTKCGETIPAGTSAAAINRQLASCKPNQFVLLGEGTFNLDAGLVMRVNNITLRGSGPAKTILDFHAEDACDGLTAMICAGREDVYVDIYGDDPPNVRDWKAGFTPGTSTITLSAVPANLQAGDIVLLDQNSDDCGERSNQLSFTSVQGPGPCTVEGGGTFMRKPAGELRRAQAQYSIVKAIRGSTITIDPPVITPQFRAAKDPEVGWQGVRPNEGIGIENLRINGDRARAQWNIVFLACKECWVKNIHGMNSDRGQVLGFQNVRLSVLDSYFWNAKAGASQSYGVELSSCTNCLVQNNIVHSHAAGVMFNGPASGNVVAYNFLFHQKFYGEEMIHAIQLHEGGSDLNLIEGNILYPGVRGDDFHGTHNWTTFLRNYLRGRDPMEKKKGNALFLQPFSRHMNVLGNVLGDEGVHDVYEGADGATAIYALGNADDPVPADPQTATTLYRRCNYDTVTNSVRTRASEVPMKIEELPQAVPSGMCDKLPASFYTDFDRVSTWWNTPSGQPHFPPIGPEVSGGNIDIDEPANPADTDLGGHVYKIPALLCYEACTKDSNHMCTDFDASACYLPAKSSNSKP